MTIPELVVRWRSEADLLRAHGAAESAATKARDADELEATWRAHEVEHLPVREAARESGYSESQLRRRFPAQRTIPRKDLPRKGGVGGPDLAGAILRQTDK